MKTNAAGIALIKKYEGFSEKPYLCPAGKRTIGYGHVIKANEPFGKITQEQGEALLRDDLQEAEDAVTRLVKLPLNTNQFSALASFTYNLGEGNLKKSTLLSLVNRGMWYMAAQQFDKWVYANAKKLPGLVKRREAEKQLFLTPV